jgi:Ca-activated chloride channel family protein
MTQHLDLQARTDRRLIRASGRSRRFVLARVTAPSAPRREERLPVNLAFILDRSGSMSGEKIALARETIGAAIAGLDDRDRFSVVAYDNIVDVVIESTPASAEARRSAVQHMAGIEARGSTALSEGWLRGAEQVAHHLADGGVNRCLLVTDGLANIGITDPNALAHHAAELRSRGVSTTTFGVGGDFDEALLQAMADAGGGHFYFVPDAVSIPDHITSEVGETLEVVAREVRLEAIAPEGVELETISPHATARHGIRASISLADLVSDQVVDVILRLTFPYGDVGRDTGVILSVGADGNESDHGQRRQSDVRLTWAYGTTEANDGQERDHEVDRAVATQFAARARQEAVRLNRTGDFGAARHVLEATAKRIRKYAGRDEMLRALVRELTEQAQQFAAPMPGLALKQTHYNSSLLARTRTMQGQATRAQR